MGALIVIFILISGYFFVHNSKKTRFKSRREEAQRYYFRCGAVGTAFIFIGIIFAFFIDHFNWASWLLRFTPYSIENFIFTQDEHFTVRDYWQVKIIIGALLAVPLSLLCAKVNNFFTDKTGMFKKLRDEYFSDIEKFLADCGDEYRTILITLSNNKVYVGLLVDIRLENKEIEYFTIIPILSGYREKDTLTVTFTTNYYVHYHHNIDHQGNPVEEGAAFDDFIELIKVSEIIHIGKFDIETYKQFQTPTEPVKEHLLSMEWMDNGHLSGNEQWNSNNWFLSVGYQYNEGIQKPS
ncbi:hypothetical protein [uncultured Shewanella sp.]|uniref:hypothetical protein n=1 Tax=uncultured Shewanella sp. TaxID=173975 RepID=UPI0026119517|nr:hypothetical protein [uncultured Shewanella sp.]